MVRAYVRYTRLASNNNGVAQIAVKFGDTGIDLASFFPSMRERQDEAYQQAIGVLRRYIKGINEIVDEYGRPIATVGTKRMEGKDYLRMLAEFRAKNIRVVNAHTSDDGFLDDVITNLTIIPSD